jgi:hypothetical protein
MDVEGAVQEDDGGVAENVVNYVLEFPYPVETDRNIRARLSSPIIPCVVVHYYFMLGVRDNLAFHVSRGGC